MVSEHSQERAIPWQDLLWKSCLELLLILSLAGAQDSWAHVYQRPLPAQELEKVLGPRRLFLLIGLNQFSDTNFPSLEFPEKDVQDLQSFLQQNNANDQDLYLTLQGPDASLAQVTRALDEIEKQNLSEQDLVLVYISSHGTLDFSPNRQLERYAVLYDTEFKRTRDKGLAIAYLENRLRRFRSQKKALILALCHSGSGKSALPGTIHAELKTLKGENPSKPLHEASSAMMILSASSWGEPAREDKSLRNDVYTHYLLEGLGKNDANQDGAISLFEAHEYARSMTYDFTQGTQTPAALVNLRGMDPMILKGTVHRKGFPLVFADSEVWRNLTLRINGKMKGSLWQPQAAESGQVRVALVDPDHPEQPLIDHSVYLQADESYSVSSLLAHKTAWIMQLVGGELPTQLLLPSLGLGLGLQDVLSTPLVIGLEYQRANRRTQKSIDFDSSSVIWNADLFKASLGYNYFLGSSIAWNGSMAAEYLTLQRRVANASYLQPSQEKHITYPSLSMEFRYHIGSSFAGIGGAFYPWRVDDELKTFTGRVALGLIL